MRKSILVIEEIEDLEKIISQGRELQKTLPDDQIINHSLEEGESRHRELISELQEAINYENGY
jgi:hypothetical protein